MFVSKELLRVEHSILFKASTLRDIRSTGVFPRLIEELTGVKHSIQDLASLIVKHNYRRGSNEALKNGMLLEPKFVAAVISRGCYPYHWLEGVPLAKVKKSS